LILTPRALPLLLHADLNRQDDGLKAFELEPPLHRERRLVVEEPVREVLVRKDQLRREEDGTVVPLLHLVAQPDDLVEEIRAERGVVLGVHPETFGELDVPVEIPLGLVLEVLDLARSLELGRVQDTHRKKDGVREVARKVFLNLKKRMNAEAVEARHEEDRRRRVSRNGRADLPHEAGI